MPIFMDRHDLPESVNAEEVARLHQEDLKIEHEFGCTGLTYWFDEHRNTAFCLIKAPNKQAIQNMHDRAHGAVPNRIIEVDPNIVESFLGRIEDPVKAQDTELNIINDPAFRVILSVYFTVDASLRKDNDWQHRRLNLIFELQNTIKAYSGSLVDGVTGSLLASFSDVSQAVDCALQLDTLGKAYSSESNGNISIGLSSGVPFETDEGLFEEAMNLAIWLSSRIEGNIVINAEVKALYESVRRNQFRVKNKIRTLSKREEEFIKDFFGYLGANWRNPKLSVNDFCAELGISKSGLYRNVMHLTGTSLVNIIRRVRMEKALQLLHKGNSSVAEVAFDTGFNSPAYFTRCFFTTYGVVPSQVTQ